MTLFNAYALSLNPDDAASARSAAGVAKTALQTMLHDIATASATVPPRLARVGSLLAAQLDDIPKVVDGLQKATADRNSALAAMDAAVAREADNSSAAAATVETPWLAACAAAATTPACSLVCSALSRAATQTGSAASQVLHAAGDVSRQAEQLTSEIGGFIAEVRAA